MATLDPDGNVDLFETVNMKFDIDEDDDIAMETDDEDLKSLLKDDSKSVNEDEAEEGELIDEGITEDPVFDEHRPLPRPNFSVSESRTPFLKLLEENALNILHKRFENQSGGFVTGVDIFSPEEQDKLTKRAQRFGINPSESKPLTQKLLLSLYESMGIVEGDPNTRFDALHMRGTEEMSTPDVFNYFKDYAPASVEWITTSSCNVIWLDDISAARALLGLSLRIKYSGQKESSHVSVMRRNNQDNEDKGNDSRISVDENVDTEDGSEKNSDVDNEESDAVPTSKISTPIPPGLWRLGVSHPRAKCIFIRFATKDDKRTSSFTGRENAKDFGGYIGLISESKKRKLQEKIGGIVFYDTGDEIINNKKLEDDEPAIAPNPWSSIAYSWGAFDRNRNKIRSDSPPRRSTPPPSPVYMDRFNRMPFIPPDLWSLKKRRREDDDFNSGDELWKKKRKVPRMRMRADDLEPDDEPYSRHSKPSRPQIGMTDLRKRLQSKMDKIRIKREKDVSDDEPNGELTQTNEDEMEEIPDLRVAVSNDKNSSDSEDSDSEENTRTGAVKSVLRGARAHDSPSRDCSDSDNDKKKKSTTKKHDKHRSRSRERHHRRSRRRKEPSRKPHGRSSYSSSHGKRSSSRHGTSYRSSNRHKAIDVVVEEEYDSDEVRVQPNAQDLRVKIGRKKSSRDRDRDHEKSCHKDSDKRERRRRSNSDNNEIFRPKSPLQIEIDNDEYYKLLDSE